MGDPYNKSLSIDKRIPPKPPIERVYGNLGDVVNYEEKHIME
jgi:hypothetical protein